MNRVKLSTLPFVLMSAAVLWFVFSPGFKTFFLAVFAFFLWIGAKVAEVVVRQLRRGKDKLGQIVDDLQADSRGFRVDRGKIPKTEPFQSLVEELDALERNPGVRDECHRALHQLQNLGELFGNFESLLRARLSPTELTYQRYLGSAQEVRDMALTGLQDVALRLRSVSVMGGDASQLRQDQADRIRLMLDQNHKALQQLSQANVAILDMKGNSAHDQERLEEAVIELGNLARRARNY